MNPVIFDSIETLDILRFGRAVEDELEIIEKRKKSEHEIKNHISAMTQKAPMHKDIKNLEKKFSDYISAGKKKKSIKKMNKNELKKKIKTLELMHGRLKNKYDKETMKRIKDRLNNLKDIIS